jgi:hypothetical protein
MFKPGGGPRLAEKHLGLSRVELFLPRNLDGHNPVELRVAGLPDRSESANADPFEQLELPERLSRRVINRLAVVLDETEAAAAGRTQHLGGEIVLDQLDRLMAVRAANAHEKILGAENKSSLSSTTKEVLGIY